MTLNRYKLAAAITIAICLGLYAKSLEPRGSQKLFIDVGENTVFVLNPDFDQSGGTGFVVKAPSGKTFIMTNAHICNMTERPYVLIRQGNNDTRAYILAISRDADLCIVANPGIGGGGLSVSSRSRARFGDAMNIIGHPYLNPLTLRSGFLNAVGVAHVSYCRIQASDGVVARRNPDDFYVRPTLLPIRAPTASEPSPTRQDCEKALFSYYTDAESAPGNSGSPVTDDSGEVVGVLFAGNGRGVSLVVPLEEVRIFLTGY